MTAPAPAERRYRAPLVVASLLAACGLCIAVASSAHAAVVDHHQVVAGLHGATVEAAVDPEGVATTCDVEFLSQAQFESGGWGAAEAAPCEPEDLGSGAEPVPTSATLEGLELSTAYRYRLMLMVAGEATPGAEGEFSTFGIESFSFRTVDATDEPQTQAGSYPHEMVVKIKTPTTAVEGDEGSRVSPTGTIRTLLNELPPGLIGNPMAVARCAIREAEEAKCTGDAQVGKLEVQYGERDESDPFVSSLYSTIPPRGKAAYFTGLINASTSGFIEAGVRTNDDYGITAGGYNISGRVNVHGITVRLWGVPADPSHDAERVCPVPGGGTETGCASTEPERPFLRNPTSCDGPLGVRARIDAYQGPGEFDEAQATLPAITGCENVEFDPSIEVRPTSTVADSPTGLRVDLRVPQHDDPAALATADLRDAVVKLPVGFTLNPSSANGLAACTPAQFGLTSAVGVAPIRTTAGAADCPEAAKIGTVRVHTPLLDHPLPGAIYVAEPYQNPFGSLLAIYIAVDDPISGVVIKLAGHVEVGPHGQLTTTFSANPQLPFEHFELNFFGGELAALKTPAVCGNYQTSSILTPWSAPHSGPPVSLTDSHAVLHGVGGSACPQTPTAQPIFGEFEAGSEAPLAGAFAPFVVRLKRPDGSQQFSSLTVTPPPGLLGRLAGVPYCPEAALLAAGSKSGVAERLAPSCSAASRVGRVVAGAGAGSKPYYVAGEVYLAGPYKGAPLSLAIVTPAVAGPYDLGNVVVRSALLVDESSAQITVRSDPIPTELKGIPLDIRSIAVKIDRPGFALNPTSCAEQAVGGQLTTVLGQILPLRNRFEVGGCSQMGFKPKLSLRFRGQTKRVGHPAIRAELVPPAGGANVRHVATFLPKTTFIDNARISSPCTRVQFNANACPRESILGRARAFSPLLDQPLEGPVYFRSNGGERELPDLVADLRGQIRIVLVGYIDTKHERIRTRFFNIPDAPVSKFVLRLFGGKRGLAQNSADLCKHPGRAILNLKGQNGRIERSKPRIKVNCAKNRRDSKRHSRIGRS